MRVLVLEDDLALARGIVRALEDIGLAVDHVANGGSAVEIALGEPYCLIILDLILPVRSGFEILQSIRRRGSAVPIMILTVRSAIEDRVTGLNLGADDYLVKPFALPEFEARVRALIRRAQGAPFPTLTTGCLTWDRTAATIQMHGQRLSLRRREHAVLVALMTHAGKVITKERLLAEVFGFEDPVAPNALELYVARVRKHLEPDGPRIQTIRGVGYLLDVRDRCEQ